MPKQKQKRKYKRYKKYKKTTNKKKFPPLERCPFIVGSNEYHNWKKERYPERQGPPYNN
tara:strand:+ start:1239 stop:1415 length:177 start_codon:yes stop_codon:yes gene_type:complete